MVGTMFVKYYLKGALQVSSLALILSVLFLWEYIPLVMLNHQNLFHNNYKYI